VCKGDNSKSTEEEMLKVKAALETLTLAEARGAQLRAGWAEKLMADGDEDWKRAGVAALSAVGGLDAFRSNVKSKNFKGLALVSNRFWQQVLRVWLDNNYNSHSSHFTPYSPIFNNKEITYKKSTLFFPECINKNIILFKDVLINNRVMPYEIFKNILNSPSSILIYNCILNAFSPKVFQRCEENDNRQCGDEASFYFYDVEVGKLGRKYFYNYLNKTEVAYVENLWERKLEKPFSKQFWMTAFNSTTETRLQVLHWKVLMNLFPTSIMLYKMGIRQSELCSICGIRDTLTHFFVQCSALEKLWKQVRSIIFIKTGKSLTLGWEHVILGITSLEGVSKNNIRVMNEILLLAKLAVSRSKHGGGVDPVLLFEHELNIRHISFSS